MIGTCLKLIFLLFFHPNFMVYIGVIGVIGVIEIRVIAPVNHHHQNIDSFINLIHQYAYLYIYCKNYTKLVYFNIIFIT